MVQAAIQLAPANARYRHSLGVVHEAAEQWGSAADAFERAVEKRPNDVKARMHWARALKSAGQVSRSAEVYRSVLQLQPDHPTAHYKMGSVLRNLGKHEEAADAYRQHLVKDPGHVQAAFWLAAVTPGPQVAACPPEIVSKLFDAYADKFDDHLTGSLGYKTPGMLMDCILQHAPVTATNTTSAAAAAATAGARGFNQPQQQQPQWSHCVDLGCGTGLMGPLLRPHTRHLSGVDLSQGMVQKARERGCYDDLSVDELGKYLSDAAAAVAQQGQLPFDLLVAADVFVYIGDLAPVLQSAAAASSNRAVFAFSTELLRPGSQQAPSGQAKSQRTAAESSDQCSSKQDAEPGSACKALEVAEGVCSSTVSSSEAVYVLQTTGRYAHSPQYLRAVAQSCGWQVLLIQEAQIRQNAGQPIWGSLCLLQRS